MIYGATYKVPDRRDPGEIAADPRVACGNPKCPWWAVSSEMSQCGQAGCTVRCCPDCSLTICESCHKRVCQKHAKEVGRHVIVCASCAVSAMRAAA